MKIDDIVKDVGAKGCVDGGEWKGYHVYVPNFGGAKVGLPLILLVKGDEVRFSDINEAFEYMDYKNKNVSDDNSDVDDLPND